MNESMTLRIVKIVDERICTGIKSFALYITNPCLFLGTTYFSLNTTRNQSQNKNKLKFYSAENNKLKKEA